MGHSRSSLPLIVCLLFLYVVNVVPVYAFNQSTLTVDERVRTYYTYVPPDLSISDPVPLMVVLPPFGASGQSMAVMTGINEAADRRGFIAVYPENPFYWDDGRIAAGLPPLATPQDDVTFITTLLTELQQSYNIDPDRIYLVGYQDSGGMVYRLACEAPELFDGAAIVGALMWEYIRDSCPETGAPLNLLLLHSTSDPLYLPQGQLYIPYLDYNSQFRILGMENTLNFWMQRNGCERDQTIVFARNGVTLNNTCADGKMVAYYNMRGAGNTWPRQATNQLNRVGVDATEILVRFLLLDGAWMDMTVPSESIQGVSRSYVFYIPSSYDPSTPMPLVVNLHMRNSDGSTQAYITDMNTVAEREGFIALYPNALDGYWNFAYDLSMPGFEDLEQNDVRFIVSLVDDLKRDLNIDSERIYLMGASNGGFMTLRTACEASDVFAAFAIVGASAFFRMNDVCDGQPPVPLLHIHGTADVDITWEGEAEDTGFDEYQKWYSVPDSIAYWVQHNACDPTPIITELPAQSEETSVEIHEYTDCANSSAVILYQINGGGHNFPGIDRLSLEQVGNVNMDFYAGDVIWEFFSQHTLSE